MIKETFTHLPPPKKETILHAGHLCFANQGVDGTTVRDIVQASHIPRGSFYQYFDDVVDVFQACISDMADTKMSYMEGLLELSDTIPFMELYERIMIQGIEFTYDYRTQAMSIAKGFNSHHPKVVAIKNTMRQEGLSMFETMLRADQSAGFLSPYIDVSVLAKVLYGFNERELMTWFENGTDKPELLEIAHQFLTIIRTGIE